MALDQFRRLHTQVAQVVCSPSDNCAAPERDPVSFALARAIIEAHPATRALPRVDGNLHRDELLRQLTADKGYTPATEPPPAPPALECCPVCGEPIDVRRDRVAILGTVVHHASCR
jgi:hypothetical protein